MSDLKPLGSEKLEGKEKLNRILDLIHYNEPKKSINESTVKPELVVEGNNCVYGIVKEKNDYYVKKGLNENSLEYIGGMFMKNKNRFSSYAEAFKKLELLKGLETIEESKEQTSTINEAKKYVLKTKKFKPEPEPEPDLGDAGGEDIPDVGDMGGEDIPDVDDMGGKDIPDVGDEETDEDDGTIKGIQKLTGKLGEKIRDLEEEIEADDIKYVLNSILAAFDLSKLSEEDREEILNNFEEDQKENEFTTGDDELPDDMADEYGDTDLKEFDIETDDAFSEFNDEMDIDEMDFDVSEDDENYFEKNNIKLDRDTDLDEEDDVKEFSLEELTDIVNKTVTDNLKNYFE